MVEFGIKLLYSCKSGFFGQKGLLSCKVVVLGKVVVFGQ